MKMHKMIKSNRIVLKGVYSMNINREKLISAINKTWMTKTCPMCGKNSWTIGDQMIAMVNVGEDKSIQLGGEFMPLVPMVCGNCGNTILINPLVIKCVDDLGD